MEQKFVYGVVIRDVANHHVVSCFQAHLIDEACAFALSLFRSVNMNDLEIAVFSMSDYKDIVVFKRS